MKYKVTGNVYFEGTIEIVNEAESVKAFSKIIFDTDSKGLAEHIAICNIAREMDFIEGVGDEGKDYFVTDSEIEYEDCEIEVIN